MRTAVNMHRCTDASTHRHRHTPRTAFWRSQSLHIELFLTISCTPTHELTHTDSPNALTHRHVDVEKHRHSDGRLHGNTDMEANLQRHFDGAGPCTFFWHETSGVLWTCLLMYIYIYTHTHIYVWVEKCIQIYVYIYVCIHICIYIYIYKWIYVYIYWYINIRIYKYVCIYMYIYIINIYIYVCTYLYINTCI